MKKKGFVCYQMRYVLLITKYTLVNVQEAYRLLPPLSKSRGACETFHKTKS